MAIKGLSIPVFGEYNYTGNKVNYSNGFVCGHAVEYGIEIELTDDNNLYGDNKIVESDYGVFNTGTLTLNTTDLDEPTSVALLGLKRVNYVVGSVSYTGYAHDDEAKAPTLGFGVIEEHQINNKNAYKAVLLPKVKPRIPADAATTRGETIEWQTKEIECGILRSDEDTTDLKHPWKMEFWFDTESEAKEFLKSVLNAMILIDVQAVEGLTAGATVVTIENPPAGAVYKYSTTGPLPTYGQTLTNWTAFPEDGSITATNGTTIYIAMVNENDEAIGIGTVTAVVKA